MRSDMYSRAAKIRDGGWTQVDAVIVAPMAAPEPEIAPEVLLEPMPEPAPISAAIPRPEPMPNLKEKECGFCITPAMAYVPMQKWEHTYEAEMGLDRGTIFPELDLPFLGGECNYE